jgi:hypothetical protein
MPKSSAPIFPQSQNGNDISKSLISFETSKVTHLMDKKLFAVS